MKCPYCAEEIKDEAIVCRYCRQNLMVFKPLIDRLNGLEAQVSEITAYLNDLQPGIQLRDVSPSMQMGRLRRILNFIFLPVLISLISYWLYLSLDPSGTKLWIKFFLWLSIICPFPFGMWFGVALNRSSLKFYVLYGAIVGILIILGVNLIFAFKYGSESVLSAGWDQVVESFLLFVLGPALLYTSGELIGDWIRITLHPSTNEKGYAGRFARRIVGRQQQTPEGGDRVRRLAEIISAIVPVLTFITAMFGVYLTYLGAVKK